MTTPAADQQFIIEQKITLLANQYRIYQVNKMGTKGKLFGFAQQKRLAFREKFEIYTSEAKTAVLLTVQARSVVDLSARYDVRDDKGRPIGVLVKSFKTSLWRSTWQICAPHREETLLMVARERNQALALVRRLWGFIPYVGEIPFFVRYHFDFIAPSSQTRLGGFEKVTWLRDHYVLKISRELAHDVDRRVLIALGVMLDALQDR